MNKIVKILMERDGLSQEEATEEYKRARELIYDAADDCNEVEEIMLDELGLEMDYIFDILF